MDEKIDELHNHPGCTDLIHDFLNLISQDMIRIRPEKRTDCAAVARRVNEMLAKCNGNSDYCLARSPRSPVKRGTNESDKHTVLERLLTWTLKCLRPGNEITRKWSRDRKLVVAVEEAQM